MTVNVDVPAEVGIPVMAPPELSSSPAGSEPEYSVQVYGGVPPVAASDWEWGEVARPLVREVVVIESPAPMVMVSVLVAVCGVGVAESVTWTVKV